MTIADPEDIRFNTEPELLQQWKDAFGDEPASFLNSWTHMQVSHAAGIHISTNHIPTSVRLTPNLIATFWTDVSFRSWIVRDRNGKSVPPSI